MRRDPTSENLDLYEFKMTLFDNGEPKKFLLFVLEDLTMLTANTKIQYLHTLLCGEAIRHFGTLCDQVGSTPIAHLNRFILGIGTYFPPVNELSKQKRSMHRVTRNMLKLKVIHCVACLICLNEYLAALPWAKVNDNKDNMELKKYFWTVCQMNGLRKHMCSVLIVKILLKKFC